MASNLPYMNTVTATTTAGSTTIPAEVKVYKITNNHTANYVSVSVNGEIGSSDNLEAKILAGGSISFELVGGFRTTTLYHKSNTTSVDVTIVGKYE